MTKISLETKYCRSTVEVNEDDLTVDEVFELFKQVMNGVGYYFNNYELIDTKEEGVDL